MRFYIITINSVESDEFDQKFQNYIKENQYEWWRYFEQQYILATPDSVSTNSLISEVSKAFNSTFFLVLEVKINDFGGVFGMPKEWVGKFPPGWSPFIWFNKVLDPNFVPKWIRNKESTVKQD